MSAVTTRKPPGCDAGAAGIVVAGTDSSFVWAGNRATNRRRVFGAARLRAGGTLKHAPAYQPGPREDCLYSSRNLIRMGTMDVKFRVVNPRLAPRRTKVEMPGWAGKPEPRSDGAQEYAWHCAPFTAGAQ